jgi:hypothetical protein
VRPRRAGSPTGQSRSADQLGGCEAGSLGGVLSVEAHDLLRDRPGSDGDLTVRVTGEQPGLQPGPCLHRHVVVGAAAPDPADPVQRVAGAAPVAGLGVLDPSTRGGHLCSTTPLPSPDGVQIRPDRPLISSRVLVLRQGRLAS